MRHRRHTITVASSTLFFVCLMLHAQTGLYSQASTPYNDAEAHKVYESLLPANWTLTVAHARRLLTQTRTSNSARSHFTLSPIAFSLDALVDTRRNFCLFSGGDTFYVPENKGGIWKSMRWRSTSRAWAS